MHCEVCQAPQCCQLGQLLQGQGTAAATAAAAAAVAWCCGKSTVCGGQQQAEVL